MELRDLLPNTKFIREDDARENSTSIQCFTVITGYMINPPFKEGKKAVMTLDARMEYLSPDTKVIKLY